MSYACLGLATPRSIDSALSACDLYIELTHSMLNSTAPEVISTACKNSTTNDHPPTRRSFLPTTALEHLRLKHIQREATLIRTLANTPSSKIYTTHTSILVSTYIPLPQQFAPKITKIMNTSTFIGNGASSSALPVSISMTTLLAID